MPVWPTPRAGRHRRWRRASRIIAGVSENCCRITYRHPVGHHPSNVGVPRMRSNALLSGGAGTTVRCEATKKIVDEENPTFPQDSSLYKDTGFQGYEPQGVQTFQPQKKPRGQELTPEQRAQNTLISKVRIVIEHI